MKSDELFEKAGYRLYLETPQELTYRDINDPENRDFELIIFINEECTRYT